MPQPRSWSQGWYRRTTIRSRGPARRGPRRSCSLGRSSSTTRPPWSRRESRSTQAGLTAQWSWSAQPWSSSARQWSLSAPQWSSLAPRWWSSAQPLSLLAPVALNTTPDTSHHPAGQQRRRRSPGWYRRRYGLAASSQRRGRRCNRSAAQCRSTSPPRRYRLGRPDTPGLVRWTLQRTGLERAIQR